MIRTDGRPTIAMRESDPIPGQMTVEECIEQARREHETPLSWDEIENAQPVFGGHN